MSEEPVIYECPNCGVQMYKIAIDKAKYNYLCPRCRTEKISYFTKVIDDDIAMHTRNHPEPYMTKASRGDFG